MTMLLCVPAWTQRFAEQYGADGMASNVVVPAALFARDERNGTRLPPQYTQQILVSHPGLSLSPAGVPPIPMPMLEQLPVVARLLRAPPVLQQGAC